MSLAAFFFGLERCRGNVWNIWNVPSAADLDSLQMLKVPERTSVVVFFPFCVFVATREHD